MVPHTAVRFDGEMGWSFELVDGRVAYSTFRIGKRKAGQLLDGQEWKEVPHLHLQRIMNTLTRLAPLYENLAHQYQSTAEMILATLHYFDPRRIEQQRDQANRLHQKADDLRRHAEALRRPAPYLESLLKTDRSLAA
jgi:hypothetical protein